MKRQLPPPHFTQTNLTIVRTCEVESGAKLSVGDLPPIQLREEGVGEDSPLLAGSYQFQHFHLWDELDIH